MDSIKNLLNSILAKLFPVTCTDFFLIESIAQNDTIIIVHDESREISQILTLIQRQATKPTVHLRGLNSFDSLTSLMKNFDPSSTLIILCETNKYNRELDQGCFNFYSISKL